MENIDENSKKFVAILNKKIETWKLFNALWHITAWLCANYKDINEMTFLKYKDKDNNIHPNISHFPFIILKADNSNQIRKVRNECIKRNISFWDFTNTMTIWTSKEQLESTSNTFEADLEYFGIVMFWNTDELNEFTGKLSLFK